jgi:DNA-binding NarL/FixJ family response regulator
VVEHHSLAAARIFEILRRERQFRAFRYGEIQARHLRPGCPLVLVVDVETVPTPIAAWLRSLPSEFGEASILALARARDDEQAWRLLLAGVHGYVPYERVEKDLNRAIKSVSRGCFWVKRSVLEKLVRHPALVSRNVKAGREWFTAREQEILRLLPKGLCNKEIASAIGIRERTVRFHLANVFRKLGVHDRHAAIDVLRARGATAKVT